MGPQDEKHLKAGIMRTILKNMKLCSPKGKRSLKFGKKVKWAAHLEAVHYFLSEMSDDIEADEFSQGYFGANEERGQTVAENEITCALAKLSIAKETLTVHQENYTHPEEEWV